MSGRLWPLVAVLAFATGLALGPHVHHKPTVPDRGSVPPGAPYTNHCDAGLVIVTTPQGGVMWRPDTANECPEVGR